MKRFLIGIAAVLVSITTARADVKLPAIFADHMVVQRDVPIAVWGWGEADEEVAVTLGGSTQTTTTQQSGKWSVKLDKLPASAEPLTLTVKGKNTVAIKDVLVGEVWLCSGQSNMAFTMNKADNFAQEQPNAKFPQIRTFTVARAPNPEPQTDCKGSWELCSPETVKSFSAAAYFFGKDLHLKLNVPVGLINSSYGGTDIAAWTSREPQESVPELVAQMAQWDANDKKYDPEKAKATYQKQLTTFTEAAKKAKEEGKPAPRRPQAPVRPTLSQNRPTNLFNGMIAPIVPYTIRGAIWYQGEHNGGSDASGALYHKQLPLLIADWRIYWGTDFPFAFVQLPNFIHKGDGWPLVREAMLHTLQTVHKTGMAITIDIGNPNDVHPTDKQSVGKRLALWALGDVYGQEVQDTCGPIPAGHEVKDAEVVVTFKHANGLVAKGGGEVKGFTIAGEDGKFVPATAKIDGDKVIVSSPEIAKPKAVRYAWQDNPACNLYNAAGIPASPFRTDAP